VKGEILLVAFGNDILGDDAVGLIAARELKQEFEGEVDFVEAAPGLELLDLVENYNAVLILDSMITAREPGTVLEFSLEDAPPAAGHSPHYAGLPEARNVAEQLGLPWPERLRILAVEIAPVDEFHEGLSAPIATALPAFLQKAREILGSWR
jgi:hydrogenase maturation protease